jgi:hypothetical protein
MSTYLPHLRSVALASLIAWAGSGCASSHKTPGPQKVAVLASSPAAVLQALPGIWVIDVEASADALARMPYQLRPMAAPRREPAPGEPASASEGVPEPFDAKAYKEARNYWIELLGKPDLQWRLDFKANGTGEHLAVIKSGGRPESVPFTWKMDGWRLSVEYPTNSPFHSFEVETTSANELQYPMKPIADHLILRRQTQPK